MSAVVKAKLAIQRRQANATAAERSPLWRNGGMLKPYYQDDWATVYHGDCREIMSGLSWKVILTDPPYGIGHPTDYADRGRGALAPCSNYAPVHGDDSPFDPAAFIAGPSLLFGANHYADKLPAMSGWIVWDKMRPHELDQATAELAWSNFVKGVRVFRYLWNGMIRDGDETLEHPTQKPAALWRWIISLKWTPPGTILDPFMGSGTTLRAAKDLGRKSIGIEIEERYCEIAARRLAQEVMDLR